MPNARGYAVIDGTGTILVRTVSETLRAAKVNWLGTYGRQDVRDYWTDKQIAEAFDFLRGVCDVAEVEIRIKRHG